MLGNVLSVNKADDGSIASVTTKEHGDLTADLYIDCTGFAGALIGEAMGSAWIGKGDTFVDRALALQVPHERPDALLTDVYTRGSTTKAPDPAVAEAAEALRR